MPTSSSTTPSSPANDLVSIGLSQVDTSQGDCRFADSVGSHGCCGLGRWLDRASVGGLMVAAGLFTASLLAHHLTVLGGVAADSAWFAAVGLGFLVVTLLSHISACQRWEGSPLAPLMISMAIRLAGTFLILVLILKLSPLSRGEAVFNVLFWYITLTATDLVGVVRQKNRDLHVVSLSSASRQVDGRS